MAKDEPARKRVGDYNPDIETGETLDGIADTDVTIVGVSFDRRNGKNGRYTLSVIDLGDRIVHTGSPVVADKLAGMFYMSGDELAAQLDAGSPSPIAPGNVFPVDATFSKTTSLNDRSRSYWTVR